MQRCRCRGGAEMQVQRRCRDAEMQRCRGGAEVQMCVIDKEERMQMRCLPRTTSHHAPYLLIMLNDVHTTNYALPL